MWFKNLKIYRLSAAWPLTGDDLEAALERQAYQPGNNLEMQAIGWIPPREGGELAHLVGGQILLTLRAEKKLLPQRSSTRWRSSAPRKSKSSRATSRAASR